MKEHWQHLFNMPTSSQDSTLDEDLQRPERTELGDKPDDKEIIHFTRKAVSKKSPGDNNIPAEFWKALVGSDDNNIPAEFWKALVGSDKDLQSEEGQQSRTTHDADAHSALKRCARGLECTQHSVHRKS